MNFYFEPLFKNQNCCCSKNHKKSKLGHKVIIFISLERSCVTPHNELITFLFSILLSSYNFFCEIFEKKKKKYNKKIMKTAMGNLSVHFYHL